MMELRHSGSMRRALRASRVVAYVVAQFLYLAFEEALRARAKRQKVAPTMPVTPTVSAVPSVHDMPTLPGVVSAPTLALAAPPPIIRVIEEMPIAVVAEDEALPRMPDVLMDEPKGEADAALAPPKTPPDVGVLLDTLRRDVGCARGETPKTHEACRAAEKLAGVIDRDAVLAALEETVTAAGRPGCVRVAAVGVLGRASRSAARRALSRMLGVTKGRAAWSGSPSDRDLITLLLHTLDA